MSNHELLNKTAYAFYLPVKIPGQTDKRLVRMSESSLDVFSYEIYPKLLSTTTYLDFMPVDRFLFDYDEDLGGVPFIEVYIDEEYGGYVVKFKICKIVNGHAIITELEAEEDLPGYDDDMGDTDHFKVAPNKILVTHRREELISFCYTKNPLRLESTREYTPIKKVDRMFPTDDRDVFCCFGYNGGSHNFNNFVFFFYNITTNQVVDYLEINGVKHSELGFCIIGFQCWEIIQSLENKSTFKVFAGEYVFEVKLHELSKFDYIKDLRRRRNLPKYEITMFGKKYERDKEEENSKETNSNVLDKIPCCYGDIKKLLCGDSTLQLTESVYLFWDSKANFFHFNNVTNRFSVMQKELFKEMGCFMVDEVCRNEEEVLYVVSGWMGTRQYLIANRHKIELQKKEKLIVKINNLSINE